LDNVVGVDNNIYVGDAKQVNYRSSGQPVQYAILRIDRKFYNLESVEVWEYHMEREGQVENADSTKTYENRILIGDGNIYENLKQHIEGVWKRKDSCIARDMVLTTSPEFMQTLSKADFEKWLTINVEWLKQSYGNNVIYAVLHLDETTAHIHVLLSVDYTNENGKRIMSNKRFFDGKAMLSELQTNYANCMIKGFKSLTRGLKGSKAFHFDVKKYYQLCAEKLDEKNIESIMAKAKNNELTEIKLKETKRTLTAYKNYQVTTDAEKENYKQQNIKLYQNLKNMQKENEMYHKGIETLAEYYKIPAKNIEKVLEYCKEKSIEKEL